MPTRGRSELARKALDYFWSQTWPNKELLILDDLLCPSFRFRPQECSHYAAVGDRLTIGTKRNWLCIAAHGDYIAHWDSDDYSAPTRLEAQYRLLESSGKAVTAFYTLTFVDEQAKVAAIYRGDPDDIVGTSLMYRRDWWKDNQFADLDVQEDCKFGRHAYQNGQLYSVPSNDTMIARVHPDNTSPKVMIGENWETMPYQAIP